MKDEICVWEKVKKKRFLLSFVQSGWRDGWEAIQTARTGVGGRALVSVCRVCDVYETPQGHVTQTPGCMSGREAGTSVSCCTLTSGSQREEQEPTNDAGSKEP